MRVCRKEGEKDPADRGGSRPDVVTLVTISLHENVLKFLEN